MSLNDKRKAVINDLIEYWKERNTEIFEDLKALKETLDKQDKEAVKELNDLLVNEWEIDDEEVERKLKEIFGDDFEIKDIRDGRKNV